MVVLILVNSVFIVLEYSFHLINDLPSPGFKLGALSPKAATLPTVLTLQDSKAQFQTVSRTKSKMSKCRTLSSKHRWQKSDQPQYKSIEKN